VSAPPGRDLELRSARGERMAGVLHEPEGKARGLVLLSPCFTCAKEIAPVRNLARDLAEAGFAALRFDPAGNGKSEGRFEDMTVARHVEDLVAIASQVETRPLCLVGHSLGGAVSILAARALKPERVVTLATNARRDSLRRLLGDEVFARARRGESVTFDSGDGVERPLSRAFVEDLERQDVLGAAASLGCPLLVVHGDADSLVPIDAGRELARVARADFVDIPGGEHLLARRQDREAVRTAVLAFLEKQV